MAKARGLATLRKDAQQSTKWRGHSMRWGAAFDGGMRQQGTCKVCGMGVMLRCNPQPNEIDIGGSAVALNCKGGA